MKIPFNSEAEEAVIGSCLLESEVAKILELEPNDFYSEYKDAWVAIQKILAEQGKIDQVTVAHELHRMKADLPISTLSKCLANTPTSMHAEHYAKIIKQCSLSRLLITAGQMIMDSGEQNTDDGVESAQQVIKEVAQQIPTDIVRSPKQVADKAEARYNRLATVKAGLSTYIQKLDNIIGGFYKGDYIILAARPSVGKTTLALQLARDIAQLYKVLYISLEMLEDSLVDKMMVGITGKAANVIRRGNYSQDTMDKLVLGLGEIADTNLYQTEGTATTAQIRRYIEKMIAAHGEPAIIFIDYLQIIADKGKSRYEIVTNISRELQNMAHQYKIPIVVISQLSRELEARKDKRPERSDLRESGALEQDADTIIFLYRESYYSYDTNDDSAELIVAKNRIGGTVGIVNLRYDKITERYSQT